MERLKALQLAMDGHGYDLVVVGPTANMRYLTGYRAMAVERITVLLVTRDAVAVVIPDFDAGEFRDTTGLDVVFEWADKHGPSEAISQAFRRLGLSGKTVSAAVDDELRFDFFTRLRGYLADQPRRASELLGPLRLSKTAAEQECIQRAGELVSYGIDIALERARPGMTELELKRAIEDALWDEGAESVDFVLVQAGANSAVGHHNANETFCARRSPCSSISQRGWTATSPTSRSRCFSGRRPLSTYASTRSSRRRRSKASGRLVRAPARQM